MTPKNKLIIILSVVAVAITIGVIVLSKKVRLRNKKIKKILFVGDSQSSVNNQDGSYINWTYPNYIMSFMNKKGGEADVLAQIGKTTNWMKDNLPSKLSEKKYDRVYIYGGGNDISNNLSLNNIVKNIQDMVYLAYDKGADVFVNLGYNTDTFSDYNKMPLKPNMKSKEEWIPYIQKRKELQKMLRKNIKKANFIDIYDLKGLTNDGIHPTPEGHKIVAKNILKTLT